MNPHDDLADGKIDLGDYLWQMADTFKAQPDRLDSSIDYYEILLEKAKVALAKAQAMTLVEADQAEKRAYVEFSVKLQGWRAESKPQVERLERVLDQVLDAAIPDELKERSVKSLRDAIENKSWALRYPDPVLRPGAALKETAIRHAKEDIESYQRMLDSVRAQKAKAERFYAELQKAYPR